MLEPSHYNLRSTYFWQQYIDRLASYLNFRHTTQIREVKINNDAFEIKCNNISVYPLLRELFQSNLNEFTITFPSYYIENYRSDQVVWMYIPELFTIEESKLILQSYVDVFHAYNFPRLFTSKFLKNLGLLIDLKDVVRKTGIQEVRFQDQLQFIWPIYFMSNKNIKETITTKFSSISFIRDEVKKIEILEIDYHFCWIILSGVIWTGDLPSLFKTSNFYKNLYEIHLSKIDVDKYVYCLENLKFRLGLSKNSG